MKLDFVLEILLPKVKLSPTSQSIQFLASHFEAVLNNSPFYEVVTSATMRDVAEFILLQNNVNITPTDSNYTKLAVFQQIVFGSIFDTIFTKFNI
jgi:hypothetical protein